MNSSKGNRSTGAGTLRVIGGKYRSRRLRVPERPGLRPTPDRVRETLFNWLGQDLDGLACLDLFAGSGALGFEAASRGATCVVMVEKDRVVAAELERNRTALNATQVTIVRGDAEEYLARDHERSGARPAGRFHVVFLDPPFRQNALPAIFGKLSPRLEAQARVYVESDEPVEVTGPWTELKRARAGQVSYQLLQWNANEDEP